MLYFYFDEFIEEIIEDHNEFEKYKKLILNTKSNVLDTLEMYLMRVTHVETVKEFNLDYVDVHRFLCFLFDYALATEEFEVCGALDTVLLEACKKAQRFSEDFEEVC